MLTNFFKYIELTKSNDKKLSKINFDYVYGNGEKNIKTKPYIYKEYEFYYEDLVNKAAYIEQIILETLITNKEIENQLNENLIILETLNDYFLIFLSRSESKTYKLKKDYINNEQLKIIVEESLNENINKIFYCLYFNKNIELYIYDILQNKNNDFKNLKINKIIFNEIIEANILFSKSLQLRKQFSNYKNITTISLILLCFILFNEFYLKSKVSNFISREYAIVKIKEKRIKQEEISTNRNLKKYTILEKKSKIQNINLSKIKDFKKYYKTEIKKLI